MHPQPSDDDDDTSPAIHRRRERQRAEIRRLLEARQLHRAADLAHEHLAEFTDDDHVRDSLTAALSASADPHVQWRVSEFVAH